MSLEPGETVLGGEMAETRAKADGVSAGAAVTLSGGDMDAVDTDANEFIGVAGEGDRLVLSGAVVVAADGVSEGDRVDGGNATNGTTGAVETSSGGPGKALSDVGGTWQGKDVPDGHAVVHL